ncbi:MAG: DUF3232 domain-containing protein [Candidatus Paceibacterota bacterium]|jgi:hypothetical protein
MNLNEAWEGLAHYEHGHDFDDELHPEVKEKKIAVENSPEMKRSVGIYADMTKKFTGEGVPEDLFTLFKQVKEGILAYNVAVAKLKLVRLEKEKRVDAEEMREETQIADRARKFAHDALIDSLNALSRMCYRTGVDNTWRSMIGSQREDVTTWAQEVVDEVRR